MSQVSQREVLQGQQARDRLLAGAPVRQVRRTVAGVSTAVLEGGAGSPVVLLHGQGAFAALWVPVMAALAPRHRVIAPDLPGLGASTTSHGPLGPEDVLLWLRDLIDQTCDEPPTLVALSLGGQVASRFAARDSRRLSRLVLADTPGLMGKPRLAPRTLAALVRHTARPTRRSTLGLLRHLVVDVDRFQECLGERWEPFLTYMVDRARTPSVKQANRHLMRQIGLREIPPADLEGIEVPTTLVWGRADRVAPLHGAEQAGRRYGWPLHVVEDAGHLAVAERPERFLTVVRAALDSSQRG